MRQQVAPAIVTAEAAAGGSNMGGDGMAGLAAAILFTMALMLVGLALASGALGWFIAKRRGWTGGKRWAAITGFAVFGMAAGWIAANSTFYESQFDPPPQLTVQVVPGFSEDWAILLEDPQGGVVLDWSGGSLPFEAPKATIVLPRGGVIRIRDFGQARGRGDLDVVWSDGAGSMSAGSGPAPPGLGATGYIALSHDRPGASGPGPMLPQGDALVAYVRNREGR